MSKERKKTNFTPSGLYKLQICFTKEQMRFLDSEVKRTGNSIASVIRNLVSKYIEER